jgi:hypothetical protein
VSGLIIWTLCGAGGPPFVALTAGTAGEQAASSRAATPRMDGKIIIFLMIVFTLIPSDLLG